VEIRSLRDPVNVDRRRSSVFKTIVLGLDGSEHSKRAIPVAVELARQDGSRIVIAHVDERIAAKGDMPSLHVDEPEIQSEIDREAERISSEGVDASVETAVVVVGGPAHAIVEIADKVDAGLIVVGTRGHSAVTGLLLGSVANRLLHIAGRPVLAIPAGD
jgi:nucleotide-binding universal stress UspA family protein